MTVEKFTGYRSESGMFFTDEHDAWCEDLNHWLKKNGVDNIAIRSQVANAIIADLENGNHVIKIFEGIRKTMPPRAAEPGAN